MAWTDPKSLTTTELEEGSDLALDFGRFLSANVGRAWYPSSRRTSNCVTFWCWRTQTESRWTTRCEKALPPSGVCREIVSG